MYSLFTRWNNRKEICPDHPDQKAQNDEISAPNYKKLLTTIWNYHKLVTSMYGESIIIPEGSSPNAQSIPINGETLCQNGQTSLLQNQQTSPALPSGGRKQPAKIPYDNITTKTVGTVGELIVAADLMARGYEVFKNVSVHGKLDLVAYKNGKLKSVQVRCVTSPNTKPNIKHKVDIIACVLPSHRVVYTPDVDLRNIYWRSWCGKEYTKAAESDFDNYVKKESETPVICEPGMAEDQGGVQ